MSTDKIYASRVKKLRRQLSPKNASIDALVVSKPENVTYLTGFSGDDSWLLVTKTDHVVLSDFRFITQLEEECPGVDVEIRDKSESIVQCAAKWLRRMKLGRVGVESDSLTVGINGQLSEELESSKAELVPTSGLVEGLREIKDRTEIAAIRESIYQAQRAFQVVRASMRPEQTERLLAAELEYQIRQFGGEGCSFAPIVAVGPRAALPHAVPTGSCIGDADFVLIDWGAQAHGYASDLTRVLVTGRISPKLERVYRVVLEAQLAAIASIRPGALMSEVDAAARSVIEEAGFGKRFGHGLGHGIGLEIHEAPRLAVGQDRPLVSGMVVTIEPGIYLPGWGGVRIEDDVLVTSDGHEVLSNLPKDLDTCRVM